VVLLNEGDDQQQQVALAFTFALDGTFLRVNQNTREYAIHRILSADRTDIAEDQATVDRFLASYQQAFTQQDVQLIDELLDPNALMITGEHDDQLDKVDYYRFNRREYIGHVQESVFLEGNSIEISFDSVQAYRDPANPKMVGIYAIQEYQSTVYSDVGYVFFMVSMDGNQPKLVYRNWSSRPFDEYNYHLEPPAQPEFEVDPIAFQINDSPQLFVDGSYTEHVDKIMAVNKLSVPVVAYPTIAPTSFFDQNKPWIIAGASLVAGGVMYGVINSGDGSGIPAPPGRPTFN
jgi:hypothetical protein